MTRCNQLQNSERPLAGAVQSIARPEVNRDNPHLSPLTASDEAVRTCLAAALAPNTRRAYAADVRAFQEDGGCVPCTDREVAAYLAGNARRWATSTLARRVMAIGQAHRARGYSDPTRSALVRDVLRGLRRLHGRPARQVQPWLLDDLDRLGEGGTLRDCRDRALLGLGFAAATRRAELVALDVSDLTFDAAGLRVLIRAAKGDPDRQGRVVAVAQRSSGLCPVVAVRRWLGAAGLDAGPLFRPVDRWGHVRPVRLSPGAVATIAKRNASRLGLDPAAIAGHSLRAGFVTSAVHAHVPLDLIRRQTGHRSLAVLQQYIRRVDPYAGTERLWEAAPPAAAPVQQVTDAYGRESELLAAASAILLRRLQRERRLANPAEAMEFLRMRLAGEADEEFFVLYLDNQHAVLAAEPMFTGTIDHAEVHPRVIVRRALELNAAALICAHNHPSGNPEPSAADRALTARLKQSLALVDVRLLDHFVVTGDRCTSMAEQGWI